MIHRIYNLIIAAVITFTCSVHAKEEVVPKSRYIFSLPMMGSHGRTYGKLTYDHEIDQHPGISGLFPTFPRDHEVKRDQNDLIVSVISTPYKLSIVPSKEAWTAGDPNAFSVIYGYNQRDHKIRTSTVARIQVDGVSVMVLRSEFHGFPEGDDQTADIEPGHTTRTEFYSPKRGHGILTKGLEVNGKFMPKERGTLIKLKESDILRLRRQIKEEFSERTNEWIKVSDVLHETKMVLGEWSDSRKVTDPDGDAITEEWEYYRNGEVTGPDGHICKRALLKRHLDTDGTETRNQYTKDGIIKETRYRDGSVRNYQNFTKQVNKDTRVETEIERLNGKKVYKSVKEYAPARHVETTSYAGRPDQVEIREYYPKGHPFEGTEKRIFYPDGTMKTIERIKLDDGNQKNIEEIGKHDGEKVIEGERTTIIFGDRPDSGSVTEAINRR